MSITRSPVPPFNFVQKIMQQAAYVIDAALPASLIPQTFVRFIPDLPNPELFMVQAAGWAFNNYLNELFRALLTKEDPTSGLKNFSKNTYTDPETGEKVQTSGSALIGLLSILSADALGLAAVATVGLGLGSLVGEATPWAQTDPFLAFLHEPLYRAPVLGFIGYGISEANKYLVLKAIKGCGEIPVEPFDPNPQLNSLQKLGQAAVEWFLDACMLELILSYVSDPKRFTEPNTGAMLGLLCAIDAGRKTFNYFAFTPQPFANLFPSFHQEAPQYQSVPTDTQPSLSALDETLATQGYLPTEEGSASEPLLLDSDNETQYTVEEPEDDEKVEATPQKQTHPAIGVLWAGLSYCATAVSYAAVQNACRREDINPALCDGQTLESRLLFGSTLAVGLCLPPLLRDVAPVAVKVISQKASQAWQRCNLFGRSPAPTEVSARDVFESSDDPYLTIGKPDRSSNEGSHSSNRGSANNSDEGYRSPRPGRN